MKKTDSNESALWKRHRRIYGFLCFILEPWMKRKFNFTFEDFDPRSIDGPLIVVPNHACAWDPLLVGAAMKKRQMYFVASEHLMRKKVTGPLLNYLVEPIPRKKASSGAGTVMACLRHFKAGHSVCIFAEGEQSWNGITQPVFPATGKLVKQSRATLVTYRLEGAYLSLPRWAKGIRRGRVYGHPAGIYPPEELKKMKPEEINRLIDRDLAFSIWDWQESQPDGPIPFRMKGRKHSLADRLEKSVFTCPECGSIGTLHSSGDEIRCSCGFCVKYRDTGYFEPSGYFRNAAEWEDYDRKNLSSILSDPGIAENRIVFSDNEATLTRIHDGHSETVLDTGTLSLASENGILSITVGERSFRLDDIRTMAPVLSSILLFSTDDEYCQIYSSEANLRKYKYAWEYINNGLFSS